MSAYEVTPDKYYHAGGSFLFTEVSAVILPHILPISDNVSAYVVSPFLAIGLGYMKECNDPFFSRDDIKADLVGIGSAMLFDFMVRKVILKR